jgi:FAD binding domain
MSEKRRSFYGWGFAEDAVSPEELGWFERAWSKVFHVDCFDAVPMPRESEITLPAPRVSPPPALRAVCTTDKYERLLHSYGRSVHDLARMILRRDFSNPPDAVAYPRDEADISAVLDWCGANDLAAIPFGGGSSVVGGVNPPRDERYRGSVTIDLKRLTRVLEIDTISQAARIQTGVLGPELERQLRPSGLTLRFFLQAWEFSSLGGWITTRAAGHYAIVYSQIDDHIESLRVVTPAGLIATRRLPTSGAGPNPRPAVLGLRGSAPKTPSVVVLPLSGSAEVATKYGECVATISCAHAIITQRAIASTSWGRATMCLRILMMSSCSSVAVTAGSGQGSTCQSVTGGATMLSATNSANSSRSTESSSSSCFASAASLASCCSLGNLIRTPNALCFSLLLRSASSSMRRCSRSLLRSSSRCAFSARAS